MHAGDVKTWYGYDIMPEVPVMAICILGVSQI